MTYADILHTGTTVFIPSSHSPVGRYLDDLPGVELIRDGEYVMTINPRRLIDIATGVKFEIPT